MTNVDLILSEKFRIIKGKIPFGIRTQLRLAVKEKKLGHVKKNGLLPEVFFDPQYKTEALLERCNIAIDGAKRIAAVCA